MGRSIAPLLGRAARRIALDEKQFRFRRITFLAVGKFAGQAGDIESALAPRELSCLACRLARRCRLDHLRNDDARFVRVFLEPLVQPLSEKALDGGAHLGRHELVFGLRGKFGIRHFYRQHAGQTLAHIITGQRYFFLLQDPTCRGVRIHRSGQSRSKPGEMGSTVTLGDIVGKAQNVLVIAIVPLQRCLDDDVVALAENGDGIAMLSGLVPVEVLDERFDTTVIRKFRALQFHAPCVFEKDMNPGIQEREFPQPVFEACEIELDVRERLGRGNKGDFGPSAVLRIADNGQSSFRFPVGEPHEVFLAVPPNAHLQRLGQRIYDRYPDTVQPA